MVAIKGRGGTGASVVTLSKALADAGHDVWVVCFRHSRVREELKDYPHVRLIDDVPMVTGFSPLKFFQGLLRLALLVKKGGIDVVHAHSSPDARLATALKVLFPHLIFVRTRHVPLPINNRLQCVLVDAISCTSFCVKRRLGFACAEDARVIYDAFSKKEKIEKRPSGIPTVVNISRYNPVKGLQFFLKAVKEIEKRLNVKSKVVGRKNRIDYYRYIEELAGKLGLTGLGLEDFVEDVASVYASSDVLCLTSLGSEGSCRVGIEAAHYGIPVVAHNVCSIPEIVLDGKTGFIVETGSYTQMADKVVGIVLYPRLRKRLAVNGLRQRGRFSVKGLVEAYERLYQSRILGLF